MATDDDGNLDFSEEPHVAYTLPDDHVFIWGIRIWTTFNADGEPQVYWHLDGDVRAPDLVGRLEMVKLALAKQQLDGWFDKDEE
jgi:hypothetical protein